MTPEEKIADLKVDENRQKANKEKVYMPRFNDRLVSYDQQAFFLKLLVDTPLQIVIVVGAVVVPILLSNTGVSKQVPFNISIVVAIAAALANRFRFGDRIRNCNLTCEAMRREHLAYELKRKPYKGMGVEEAFELFMDRVEEILKEHSQRSISLTEQKKSTP